MRTLAVVLQQRFDRRCQPLAAFEEGGLFNTDLARRFRENILEVGGSRDIAEAFIAFRGRPAHVDALLKQTGITA